MHVEYDAHGECSIQIVDDVILIEARGPWNLEFTRDLHRRLASVASNFAENQTFLLIRFFGEAIAVEAAINEHIKFINYRRATAVAIDFSNCTTAHITRDLYTRIYNTTQQKHRFFDDFDEAWAWIKSQQGS